MSQNNRETSDADRAARRARALRENLRRRKAAARKQAGDAPPPVSKPGNSRD